jgi:hypothetical protein
VAKIVIRSAFGEVRFTGILGSEGGRARAVSLSILELQEIGPERGKDQLGRRFAASTSMRSLRPGFGTQGCQLFDFEIRRRPLAVGHVTSTARSLYRLQIGSLVSGA